MMERPAFVSTASTRTRGSSPVAAPSRTKEVLRASARRSLGPAGASSRGADAPRRCTVALLHAMEHIARAFEWIGISVIVLGSLVTAWVAAVTYRRSGSNAAYIAGRQTFGRGLLAGLEVL